MTQDRWAPSLPSFGGRLAPRVVLDPLSGSSTFTAKLERYYMQRRSCLSMFARPVSGVWAYRQGLLPNPGCQAPRLEDLRPSDLYRYMIQTLGHINMSLNFQRKLTALCEKGDIATIKRWWQTTDGVVYPLLLTVENPDEYYRDIDRLTKFSLENCANNYAQFTSRMKSLKRLIRKDYATGDSGARSLHDVGTYWKMFKKHFPDTAGKDPHREVQFILCWAQTRASGLADSAMIRRSLDKCEDTLKERRRPIRLSTPQEREYSYREQPVGVPVIPREILQEVSWRTADRLRGETAHIPAGPNACLEMTRQQGGQTGFIKTLASRRCLGYEYDFRTLERRAIAPRPVRSTNDLLSWSVHQVLEHPTYVRCVRLHAVAEPSKARTITVCSFPYLTVVGVLSKLLQPAIASDITRTGLRASRNLWAFLFEDLDPNLGVWGHLRDDGPRSKPILGLSSDLSEATDYGDLGVARQILDGVIKACSDIPGFPVGLALLAKTLFIGKRFCFRYYPEGVRWFTKLNGWLMGDRITKVLLTLAHEIVVISSGLRYSARICGDDIIAFSRHRDRLEKYLEEVRRLGFKVSEEDSYISSRLAFYCEEGCIPPQAYYDLPAVALRRGSQSCYIDYPRIRLLIPTCVETQAYSYTDIGRFSLLGKETRWVHQNKLGPRIRDLFHRAGLYQHLNVPRPADVICPYIPVELGGDGAFPPNHTFLKDVVLAKSKDFREVQFRLNCLMKSKWGFRFVRNPNLNDVVHKYHVLVPKIEELKSLLPPEAIVEGNELLLGSIKVGGLESPERTFFRIQRAYHWSHILATGKEPPKINFGADREFHHGQTDINMDDVGFFRFFSTWRDSGFTFRDQYDYRVETRLVNILDYMSMGWWFGKPAIRGPRTTLADIGGRKLLNEENIENFIAHIKSDESLDPKVQEHLYKYVEADSYIMYDCHRRWSGATELNSIVLLVTADKKLAANLARMLAGLIGTNQCPVDELPCVVFTVPPMAVMTGQLGSYEDFVRERLGPCEVVIDFGAVAYAAAHSTGTEEWYDDPVVRIEPLWRGRSISETLAAQLVLDERASGGRELISLTTQPAGSVRRRLTLRAREA